MTRPDEIRERLAAEYEKHKTAERRAADREQDRARTLAAHRAALTVSKAALAEEFKRAARALRRAGAKGGTAFELGRLKGRAWVLVKGQNTLILTKRGRVLCSQVRPSGVMINVTISRNLQAPLPETPSVEYLTEQLTQLLVRHKVPPDAF